MGLFNLIRMWLGYKFILNTHTMEAHAAKHAKGNCGMKYMSDKHKRFISMRKYNKLLKQGEINSCRWCLGNNVKEITDSDHSWWIG